MIPKEKAQELVSRFLSINLSQVSELVDGIRIRLAKESALIAVDEILELTKRPTYNPFDWNEITGVKYDKYWQEVKQEIENL